MSIFTKSKTRQELLGRGAELEKLVAKCAPLRTKYEALEAELAEMLTHAKLRAAASLARKEYERTLAPLTAEIAEIRRAIYQSPTPAYSNLQFILHARIADNTRRRDYKEIVANDNAGHALTIKKFDGDAIDKIAIELRARLMKANDLLCSALSDVALAAALKAIENEELPAPPLIELHRESANEPFAIRKSA